MHGCVSSSSSRSSLRSSEGEAAVSSSRSDTACNAPSRGAGTDQAEDARNMCRLGRRMPFLIAGGEKLGFFPFTLHVALFLYRTGWPNRPPSCRRAKASTLQVHVCARVAHCGADSAEPASASLAPKPPSSLRALELGGGRSSTSNIRSPLPGPVSLRSCAGSRCSGPDVSRSRSRFSRRRSSIVATIVCST